MQSYSFTHFPNPKAHARVVLLSGAETGQALWPKVRPLGAELFCIDGIAWNCDMSPWPAPSPFRGGEDFSGGGDAFLQTLLARLPESDLPTYLVGYSLAGLFALWALTKTAAFAGAACVSGSVWYPGFVPYLASNPPQGQRVYLSYGAKEPKTRNPAFQALPQCAADVQTLCAKAGLAVQLAVNPGGHGSESLLRQQNAIAWLVAK